MQSVLAARLQVCDVYVEPVCLRYESMRTRLPRPAESRSRSQLLKVEGSQVEAEYVGGPLQV